MICMQQHFSTISGQRIATNNKKSRVLIHPFFLPLIDDQVLIHMTLDGRIKKEQKKSTAFSEKLWTEKGKNRIHLYMCVCEFCLDSF